jgi:hypothetical protein
MDTITAIAIPRSSHSVAAFPAATTMFDAKTMQPDASRTGDISMANKKRTGKHTCKPECDSLNRENNCNQELRLSIGGFEVYLFSSTAWHHATELKPYTQAGAS